LYVNNPKGSYAAMEGPAFAGCRKAMEGMGPRNPGTAVKKGRIRFYTKMPGRAARKGLTFRKAPSKRK